MNYNANELLEEEMEIIEIFIHELSLYGYKGYCSFYEKVDNGYYIYKDNDKWIYEFNEKGETISIEKYTNIYNLCFDILEKFKIDMFYFNTRNIRIPHGTKVIISENKNCLIDEIKMGTILDSKIVPFSSFEERRIYQVLGDDGNIYQGLYGFKIYGDICFRTIEDYIKDTKKEIEENKGMIQELHETNWELFFTLNDAINEKNKYFNNNKRK